MATLYDPELPLLYYVAMGGGGEGLVTCIVVKGDCHIVIGHTH